MNMEKFKEAGINYESGVKRFAGRKELYEKYVVKFKDSVTFQELEESMANEDYEQAFRKAHDLKGMVGNLSFDVLFEKICSLVEALRTKKYEEAKMLLPLAREAYAKVMDAILNL